MYNQPRMSKRIRINDYIRAPSVRLIDEEGEPLGVFLIERAKEMAREQELDLVEVAPNAQPPVCKIMDFGKYMYRQQKMERKHKAQQKQTEVKGIRISLRIGTHDLEVKAKQAKQFLADRNLVKVVLMFRGREGAHLNLGYDKLSQLYNMMNDVAKVEEAPKRQGNQLIMILAPGSGSVAQFAPPAPRFSPMSGGGTIPPAVPGPVSTENS
jgi:translation initiation factor IF-3